MHGCQLGFWTIHRLLDLARKAQADTAQKLAVDGVTEDSLALFLGVDKLCHGKAHYPLGDAHGVHTLMKGLATRLEDIASWSSAHDFLIFESDATVVASLGGRIRIVLDRLRAEGRVFRWLGFFTDGKPNHNGREKDVALGGGRQGAWLCAPRRQRH